MAVPKKKISKSVSKTRRSSWVALNRARLIRETNVVSCAACGEPKLSHTICPACKVTGSNKLASVVTPNETTVKTEPKAEKEEAKAEATAE